METWTNLIDNVTLGVPGVTMMQALLGLLLAFILGQFNAWVYVFTHSGLSYSRAFVQSIVLLTIIVSMAMLVIGNNVIVAFGLIGALAVIRFRNVLKDTRDTAFIFFSLIAGMATGTGRYKVAILGTLVFTGVLLYMHFTSFGSRFTSDGFIRFQTSKSGVTSTIQSLFKRYCRKVQLVSHRMAETGSGEMAYQLTLRDPARAEELVSGLRNLEGVSNVTFVLQEDQTEI